jgi:glycosyltransferase involved in cell wall biosynthesis
MTSDDAVANDTRGRPRVTIAIPTYNRAAWIEGAVMAALAQTYPDFEVLVSDNASTDATPSVLSRCHDPRLRVVMQDTNLGLTGNWNACLAEARGDYIALVPDDDRISPWFLARCMTLVAANPGLPIVLGLSDLRLVSQCDRLLKAPQNKAFATGVWDGLDILNEFLEDRISAQMCSILVRTQDLREQGGFPQGMPFAVDKAGWAPVLLKGRAGFVNESCGTFNEHETNHTNSLDAALCLDDEWRFAALLMTCADQRIPDPARRRRAMRGAKRYFGRRALELLSVYRKGGASLSEVLPLAWRWRASFVHLRVSSPVRFARLVSVLLLPKALTAQMRRLKRYYERDLSWKT